MTESEVTPSADDGAQEASNKTWGAFWEREKAKYQEEVSRVENMDTATLAQQFFAHKVFRVGYPVFKKYIPSTPGLSILDVGTGSGRYGLKVAMDFPQSRVTMTDVIPEALSYVETVAARLGLANTDTKQEDSRKLSFPDASFDVVMCDAVIQYIPEYAKSVAEMARVLRPGGTLIISTVNTWNFPHTLHKWWVGERYPHGWEKSFTHNELGALFEKSGVRVTAHDGYYFIYGLYRLGYERPWLKMVALVISRILKIVDAVLGRIIDRTFGFQLIVAGKKRP